MHSRVKLKHLLFKGTDFTFDPTTGQSYTINSSSLRIITWLREGCHEDEIPARLAAEFDTDLHVARRDTDGFLSALRTYRLL